MSKHTPGPWHFDGEWLYMPAQKTLHSHFARLTTHWPEFEANARLIAAAPDLLEALENALAYVDDACHFPEQFKRGVVVGHAKQVRAALAKATGESWPMPGKGWLK